MKKLRPIILRYVVALAAFLLPLLIAYVMRLFSINFDVTLLIVAAIIASAWYGGTGPGLMVAILFELTALTLLNPRPVSTRTLIFAEFNRTALLVIFALLASSRRTSERRLRQQREWLQVTLSSIGDAVIATDLNGQVTFMNPTAEEMTHWTMSQATGNPVDEVFQIINKESHEIVDNPVRKMIREGLTMATASDVILTSKERTNRPIDYSVTPIRNQARETTGAVLVFRDVSERERLQDQFRQAQKMEAVGRLAGGIAHDFNNLLTVIMGYSELLLNQAGLDAKLRSEVEEISAAGKRAALLTSQLLTFSRRQLLQPKVLNLNESVVTVEKMLRRVLGEDIDIVTIARSGLGLTKADPGQIEQVLMNLAVNARDAMPNGGKLTIETANVELDDAYAQTHADVTPGRYVLLAVSDSGHGMDDETQSHIFEPFFTTKEQGKGTGLGLSTVFGIVKQSGGHIWVYSEPGHGVAFKIYFPRVDEVADSRDAQAETVESLQGSETIMLVEDDESVRNLAELALEMYGYTVLAADRGAQALETFGPLATAIDLVITDVIMPQMSGAELVVRLKELHPEVKVLYVSGYTEEATIHRGVIEEGMAFLQKPFTPDGLVRRVREVLDAQPPNSDNRHNHR